MYTVPLALAQAFTRQCGKLDWEGDLPKSSILSRILWIYISHQAQFMLFKVPGHKNQEG